ncbi:MAG: hypothetical protein JWM48_1717 [Mycobacterium sp.]|nr:hypothetical protein [Mycobacterium sp.]
MPRRDGPRCGTVDAVTESDRPGAPDEHSEPGEPQPPAPSDGVPGSEAGTPDAGPQPSARDLVRRRRARYAAPQTGRIHHLGTPPAAMPVHTPEGLDWSDVNDARLRELPIGPLQELADELTTTMAGAAAHQEYERAASLRDRLERVRAELARRAD